MICLIYLSLSGAQQSLPGTDGPLAMLDSSKGLYRVSLLPPLEIGIWQLSIKAIGPTTFSILGKDASLNRIKLVIKLSNKKR